MITLRNIRKNYRADNLETAALADVSLQIDPGEFVAVMGPSGCGKSTLLNVVGMIDSPSSGEYLFCGQDIASWRENRLVELRKRNLGFIFQSFNLIDELTVYENIELPLLYQNTPRSLRKARVREVLELVDLHARAQHRPAQLSGGQQQRVAIARAIVTRPALLVADEPTGNLDTAKSHEIMTLLTALNRDLGLTILMVTHEPDVAAYAQRTIGFLDGHIESDTLALEAA